MTTLADLTDDILASLHSYTGANEARTWLTGAVDSSTLTLPVANSDTVVRGQLEIDDELMYAATSDAGTVTLAPFGRGYRGTSATTHAENAQITVSPMFPRVDVKRKINQLIESLYPDLYAVKTTVLTGDAVSVGYEMPTEAEGVLRVEWHPLGDVQNWWPLNNKYTFDQQSEAFASGKTLTLYGYVDVGSDIKVTYKARPTPLSSPLDTLADSGLDESAADLILYGVTAQMIRFLDSARLSVRSVENVARAQVVGAGDATKIANGLYAMYSQRLQEERRRLLLRYPPTIVNEG